MDLQIIQNRIIEIRGQRVMLDFHLAELYEVETKVLKQAVRRNIERFPEDFMFELTKSELDKLRSQTVTFDWKPTTYAPFVFTEQGVAMLSSVLKSKKAIRVNVEIIRAFVQLRKLAIQNSEIIHRIDEMEKKYDKQFKEVFTALRYLIHPPEKERRRIGYKK
ncbi:ORF6N domain-containing protein [Draconibacterium sp. IB214405]|uniref:ORF6N domain-containing protein n=1 Tax=Draconibacterium sp. IB214405 TaxID=3097352 RepID=UPI002A0B5B68|nr:ORF6N domain-containing protein [Draconibacterium sp. IB214405]MDX8341635.1 ORF6N domain-containing protein [Draconibacterium sp. IB214405]